MVSDPLIGGSGPIRDKLSFYALTSLYERKSLSR